MNSVSSLLSFWILGMELRVNPWMDAPDGYVNYSERYVLYWSLEDSRSHHRRRYWPLPMLYAATTE